jgi:hypothetical protein
MRSRIGLAGLGLGHGGDDAFAFVLDHAGDEVAQQGAAGAGIALEFEAGSFMSHL